MRNEFLDSTLPLLSRKGVQEGYTNPFKNQKAKPTKAYVKNVFDLFMFQNILEMLLI
jgi:hypothetical protein